MKEIIQALLDGSLDLHHIDYNSIPEYAQIDQLRDAQYRIIVAALGPEFAEEVWTTATQRAALDGDCYFERGIRLGGQLIIAMLS